MPGSGHVQGLPSCRILAAFLEQRLGRPVSRSVLNGWVDKLGGRAKTPLEVSAELRPPRWGGFLGIDGKAVWVAGEEHALLIGVDHPTHDIVNGLLLPTETGEGAGRARHRRSRRSLIPAARHRD